MNCKKCAHEVHEDSQGIVTCLSCGYREEINQVRDTTVYNNKDLMKRESTNDAGEKLQSTEETLKERGNRYGEFRDHARLSQSLKISLNFHINEYGQPEAFTDIMAEAVEMICHKLARIANGDPSYVDSWADICGYSQLVVDELTKEQK